MKRLAIIMMVQAAVHAELSAAKPARAPDPDGTAISVDIDDSLISRPSRFEPVEIPRTAPGFAASLPAVKLRARWTRPVDLSRSSETGGLSRVFQFGGSAAPWLLALTVIFYVRARRRSNRRPVGPRALLARATPFPGAGPLSTLKK